MNPIPLFDYNRWANQKIVGALNQSLQPSPEAIRYFCHILTAERAWLRRMEGVDTRGWDFWPVLTLAECLQLAAEVEQEFSAFLNALAEGDLEQTATYRNSQNVEYTTKFRDILIHVAFHGAYHRGQVAAALRHNGEKPPNTDYIGFEREVGPLPA
ncbi:MAG: DinB family protein [Blastocatellia bacterium]|nr:DinB family protein [Blastocatellia bacterium]